MIDWLNLFEENSIPYDLRDTATNSLLTFHCPFCVSSKGSKTLTGAFFLNSENNFFETCFRCGSHKGSEVISAFLDISEHEANKLIRNYDSELVIRKEKTKKNHCEEVDLSFASGKLDSNYSEYLQKRGFNPVELTRYADLRYTLHFGEMFSRIVFPIYYRGKIISYTSRSILPDAEIRYISCKAEDEVIDHKHICYGLDHFNSDKVLLVESPINSLKLGNDTCLATFGISFTEEQVNLLKNFKKIDILFDSEARAQKKAMELAKELKYFSTCRVIDLEFKNGKDLGDCTKEELQTIRKELGVKPIVPSYVL